MLDNIIVVIFKDSHRLYKHKAKTKRLTNLGSDFYLFIIFLKYFLLAIISNSQKQSNLHVIYINIPPIPYFLRN